MWIVESRPNRACLRIDRLLFVDTEKWCCYLIRRHRLCSPTMRKRFLQTCPVDWAAQDSARSHHHLRRSRSENYLSFWCCRVRNGGMYDGGLTGKLPTEIPHNQSSMTLASPASGAVKRQDACPNP